MKNIMTLFVIFSCMQIHAQHISNSEINVLNALINSRYNPNQYFSCINEYSLRLYLNESTDCDRFCLINNLGMLKVNDSLRHDFYKRVNYYFNGNRQLMLQHFNTRLNIYENYKIVNKENMLSNKELKVFCDSIIAYGSIKEDNISIKVIAINDTTGYDTGKDIDFFENNAVHEYLINYLNENLIYPDIAFDKYITGRVIVKFMIDESGHTQKVTCNTCIHPLLDDEACRIVKSLQLQPYIENTGIQYSRIYYIPIYFGIKMIEKRD